MEEETAFQKSADSFLWYAWEMTQYFTEITFELGT